MTSSTSIATVSDKQPILKFLDSDNLAMNVWLIQAVCGIIDCPADHQHVLVSRVADEIVGVASVSGSPGAAFNEDCRVRMDATDCEAAAKLINALPPNVTCHFQMLRPMLQQYLTELPGMQSDLACLYYTVSQSEFQPTDSSDVVQLTVSDRHFFEGCERQYNWEDIGTEHRVFGIVRNGKVAASVGCSPVTPMMPSGRCVVAISGLHTETEQRRKGLARQLVSYTTDLILRDGNIPCYWTEPENLASQALCQSLGYYQYSQELRCMWPKESRPAAI